MKLILITIIKFLGYAGCMKIPFKADSSGAGLRTDAGGNLYMYFCCKLLSMQILHTDPTCTFIITILFYMYVCEYFLPFVSLLQVCDVFCKLSSKVGKGEEFNRHCKVLFR